MDLTQVPVASSGATVNGSVAERDLNRVFNLQSEQIAGWGRKYIPIGTKWQVAEFPFCPKPIHVIGVISVMPYENCLSCDWR